MLLAKDGVFPITKDHQGNPLTTTPASGLDVPGTIQGEGKLCGIPSLFIRLAGCNLRCCWQTIYGHRSACDTAYAAYELSGTQQMPVDDIYTTVLHNTPTISHLVITGGEPFLQAKELKLLCDKLKQNNRYHLTIETNATLFDPEVAQYVDLFSLSPKLSSSHVGQKQSCSIDLEVIRSFIDYARQNQKDFQLKFVYSCERDIDEIHKILAGLTGWKNEDILLMPLGGTLETLRINTMKTLEHCIRNGWRYCDRLHISLFGSKNGV